jgi:hypothetical protein
MASCAGGDAADNADPGTGRSTARTITVTRTTEPSTPDDVASTPTRRTVSETSPPPIQGRIIHLTTFQSPTRNISCDMSYGVASCQIDRFTFPPPRRPADCDLDWTPTFQVADDEAIFGTCQGDAQPRSDAVLPYGTATVVGKLACLSRRTGIDCWNTRTRHGFHVSRSAHHLY